MQTSLPEWWTVASEVLKALGGVIALAGFAMALLTFMQSVRTKRAEWLASLHKDFFESGRYDTVRRILDYEPRVEYARLRNAVEKEMHVPAIDELHRYLNFFEFLAGLRKLNQISDDEIIGLFDYDLKLIRRTDFIGDTLREHGYERLADLLDRTHPKSPDALQSLGTTS
jgi:hypothetical protein